ncbi:MAG: hypothetical protein HDQ90_07955 [Desulfovibrio sp.]|nr:hypothetical protein [Desulfovibrio sp.]
MSQYTSTAIILGNGPSLRGFNFPSELKGFISFGMNAAYRYWNEINWYPTYYACLDSAVGMSHREGIYELVLNSKKNGIKKFILRADLVRWIRNRGLQSTDIVNFDFWHIQNKFTQLFSTYITTGALTTLWAISMNFTKIILLGIDANFPAEVLPESVLAEQVDNKSVTHYKAHKYIVRKNPRINKNYFFDTYQQKGDIYYMADKNAINENQMHIYSWDFLPRVIGSKNVEVINANPDSNINLFKKIPWRYVREELLSEEDNYQS